MLFFLCKLTMTGHMELLYTEHDRKRRRFAGRLIVTNAAALQAGS